MSDIQEDLVNLIIRLLSKFLEGKIRELPIKYRRNPKIFHYYNEIVRNWSKLNFIINKTMRALNKPEIKTTLERAKFLYITCRICCENASNNAIKDELNTSMIKEMDKLRTFSWEKALVGKSNEERLSIKEAIPSFFINNLLQVVSFEFIKENIRMMNDRNQQESVSVRINDLSRDNADINLKIQIQEDLKKNGIKFKQDPVISEIIHIPSKLKFLIFKNKWYQRGNLIFQDKGSAAVVNVLSPSPNEHICDLCAAPGIKTSQIAQSTCDKSCIIGCEFNTERMNTTKKLLNHYNVLNAHLINADGIKFPVRSDKKFDKILLDAPCTGSGTFLTNPELKWRQNEKFLNQNIVLQKKLLDSAISLLKPNGILVYSTCSLYPEEGELQILKFLDDLEPLELPEWFSRTYKIKDSEIPGTGRLFPSLHKTKGFFIGKFKKKER